MKKVEWVIVSVLLAFMLIPVSGIAQSDNIEVELSAPHRVIDAANKIYLSSDNFVVAFKYSKADEIYIQGFNKGDLSEVSRNIYGSIDRKASIEYFGVLDNRFYMFYTAFDKDNETENLYSLEIDPRTSQVIGGVNKVLTVEGKLSGNVKMKGLYGLGSVKNDRFRFDFSIDDKHMMIYYIYAPEIRDNDKNYDKLGIHVFNNELVEQWNTNAVMKYTESQMSFQDFEIDNNGDVFVLYDVLEAEGDKGRYEILRYTEDEPEGTSWDINIKNYDEIEDLAFYEKDEDEFIIGGVYEMENGLPGLFVVSMDKDDDGIEQHYVPIPEEVLNAFNTEKENKKKAKTEKKGDDYNAGAAYVMDGVIYGDDGSLIIVGEEFWKETRSYTSSNGSYRTTTTYFYGDIIATKINADGDLLWSVKIPKEQKGAKGKGGMSYEFVSNSESLYFLYLDHEDNLNLSTKESPKTHADGAGGFMTAAKVDVESGALTKKHLYNMRDVKGVTVYQFSTDRIVQLDNDDIAVELYKKKKEDIWVRVRLK